MIEIKNARGEVIFVYHKSDGNVFDDADLSGANLAGAVLEGAWFNDATLSGANLEGANLYWAIFFRATIRNANLRNSLLAGCDFKEADLEGTDLSHANLGSDNLGGATQLQGANLTDCKVGGTNFDRAEYDTKTRFPFGFDPEKHNMVLKTI